MAASNTGSQVFTSIDQLRPDNSGQNLIVKVIDAKIVLHRPPNRTGSAGSVVAECLVGDETGVIVFTARNEQADVAKPDTYIVLRNAKIDMFRGSMRLTVNQGGKVEHADSTTDFKVKVDDNMSLVEYELVQVPQATPAAAVEAQ